MSSRGSEAVLETLRLEFEALRLTVRNLEARVSELEGRPLQAPATTRVATPESSSFSRSAVPIETGDHEGRAALARECGGFLRRAYEGRARGPSGRDRLSLASRIYVVLGDHSGRRFPQPKVFKAFGPVKEICKVGPSAGDSVFLGFPTIWEAKIAVQEAGFDWPEGVSEQ